jgi:hypothetical protein
LQVGGQSASNIEEKNLIDYIVYEEASALVRISLSYELKSLKIKL